MKSIIALASILLSMKLFAFDVNCKHDMQTQKVLIALDKVGFSTDSKLFNEEVEDVRSIWKEGESLCGGWNNMNILTSIAFCNQVLWEVNWKSFEGLEDKLYPIFERYADGFTSSHENPNVFNCDLKHYL